jgi:DNA-binding beta-propeller fold protein YncE
MVRAGVRNVIRLALFLLAVIVIVRLFAGLQVFGKSSAVLTEIPDRPTVLTVDEKSGFLYVFGQDNGEILVFNPAEGMKPIYRTKMFEMPLEAVYDPVREKVYELQYLVGRLIVLDAKGIAVGKAPTARWYFLPDGEKGAEQNRLALDARRNRLWIIYTNYNKQALYVFDTVRERVRKIKILETPAVSLAVDPASGDIFLRHRAEKFITRLDGETLEERKIALPAVAGEMYFDGSTGILFILAPFDSKVFAYNAANGNIREIGLGKALPSFIIGLPSQGRLFAISKFSSPNISIIDTLSGRLIGGRDLPAAPLALFAADNLGLLGVVTAANNLAVLNSDGKVIREIELPPLRVLGDLWTWPRLPIVYDGTRNTVYVASPQLNALARINLRTFEAEYWNWPPFELAKTEVELPDVKAPSAAFPERDFMATQKVLSIGDRIFVLNYAGFITVLDSRLYRTLKRIKLADVADSMVYDGKKLYVSSALAGKVFRINPDNYEIEKEYSVEGLGKTYWYLVPLPGKNTILVVNLWSGEFAFINTVDGRIGFSGNAGAAAIWAGYNPRSGEAVFVSRGRGIIGVNLLRRSIEPVVTLPFRIPDEGPFAVDADLERTNLVYLMVFDGNNQRVIGVDTLRRRIVSAFSVGSAPHTRYDAADGITFNFLNNRILVAFPGRLLVTTPEGKAVRDYLFDGYGRKVSGTTDRRAGEARIFRFWNVRNYDIYFNVGTKIMRVNPETYAVSDPIQTLQDESEGHQAIGLLGVPRRILPDPEKNKLYIVYNYDGLAVYDFTTSRVWFRANPGLAGISWSAYHIVSPLAPRDEPQPEIPPWVTRERNIRLAFITFGGLIFAAAAYAGFRMVRKKIKALNG